jgi:hypothetical protein
VYFVTGNHRDFGDGSNYPSPMAEDIGEMKSRLHFLATFEDFISRFTEKIEVDDTLAKEILSSFSRDSIAPIERHAYAALVNGSFEGTRIEDGSFEKCQWLGWLSQPTAVVYAASSASAHRIGDGEWYTADVDWILVGFASLAWPGYKIGSLQFAKIACQWRTKILFSTGTGESLKVIASEYPEGLDGNNRAELQPLIDSVATTVAEKSSNFFGAIQATYPSLSFTLPAGTVPSLGSLTFPAGTVPSLGSLTFPAGTVPSLGSLTFPATLFPNSLNTFTVPAGAMPNLLSRTADDEDGEVSEPGAEEPDDTPGEDQN